MCVGTWTNETIGIENHATTFKLPFALVSQVYRRSFEAVPVLLNHPAKQAKAVLKIDLKKTGA